MGHKCRSGVNKKTKQGELPLVTSIRGASTKERTEDIVLVRDQDKDGRTTKLRCVCE